MIVYHPTAAQKFEIGFVFESTIPVVNLGRPDMIFFYPRIDGRDYQMVLTCDCPDRVAFAKVEGKIKELYTMCDKHGLQPHGVLVSVFSRSRAGSGRNREWRFA